MSFASIGAALSIIKGLYSAASAVGKFFGADDFTLEDVERALNSSNAHFFEGWNLTDLKTKRDRFYGVLERELRAHATISATDLAVGGTLHDTYQDVRAMKEDIHEILQRLNWLWTNNELHVDDNCAGLQILTDGYALLLHMQAVYSQLHLVEFGYTSLDDPGLYGDTLATRLYLKDALDALVALKDTTFARRMEPGVVFTFQHSRVGGAHTPKIDFYTYEDRYVPERSTPRAFQLIHIKPTAPPPADNLYPDAWLDTAPAKVQRQGNKQEASVRAELEVRQNQTRYQFAVVAGDNADVLVDVCRQLKQIMAGRGSKQNPEDAGDLILYHEGKRV